MVKGTQAVSLHPPKGEMVASTDVYRGDEGASASVSVSITGLPEPAGDLCATAEVLHQGADDGCKVVTASNGDRVRYSWRVIAGFGRIDYAARFHAGGYVVVHQSPGGLRPDKAPRTAGFWTEAQMVDAATTAAFWPTNLGPFTGGIGHPPRSR
jgi:hypothetical protein